MASYCGDVEGNYATVRMMWSWIAGIAGDVAVIVGIWWLIVCVIIEMLRTMCYDSGGAWG
jgi:hypothetical protein